MSIDATTPPPFNPSSCAACRVLDASDGTEDGSLFSSTISGVPNEHWLWHTLRRAEDRTADRITIFAGSMRFVYIHAIWFAVWVLVNIGLAGAGWEFDGFPFGLLTMIVSLEAIFLATFVMISQNRQSQRSDLRAEIDFETNLRAAIWSMHIGEALGIDTDHVEGVVRHALVAAHQQLEKSDAHARPSTTTASTT
ncbi:MAG: DUF1003 domain-containing protein [Acidimicrobiales bacterium]